jgi:hypothetical protein
MKLDDYSILKNLKRDANFEKFIRDSGERFAVPILTHHFSEEYGYTQRDAFSMAKMVVIEWFSANTLR